MVVEHAERFGLAQLHQLRGRVGRGAEASFCLLLHEDGLNEIARRRLTLLRDTEDGFVIADEDFRLRGGGDLLGHAAERAAGVPPRRPGRARGSAAHGAPGRGAAAGEGPEARNAARTRRPPARRLFERGAALRTLRAG